MLCQIVKVVINASTMLSAQQTFGLTIFFRIGHVAQRPSNQNHSVPVLLFRCLSQCSQQSYLLFFVSTVGLKILDIIGGHGQPSRRTCGASTNEADSYNACPKYGGESTHGVFHSLPVVQVVGEG